VKVLIRMVKFSFVRYFFRSIDIRRDVRKYVTEMFRYLPSHATVYDISCGSKPICQAIEDLVCKYIGTEYELLDTLLRPEHLDRFGIYLVEVHS
jgi:hypothetical protein